jgi:hypothetical protein
MSIAEGTDKSNPTVAARDTDEINPVDTTGDSDWYSRATSVSPVYVKRLRRGRRRDDCFAAPLKLQTLDLGDEDGLRQVCSLMEKPI